MESPKVAPAPVTHTVTIKPAQGPCTVEPFQLNDVGRGEWVEFKNQVPKTTVKLTFDPGLFDSPPIDVGPDSAKSLQVSSQAQDNTTYSYTVSCLPASEARPRIVIRGQSPDSVR